MGIVIRIINKVSEKQTKDANNKSACGVFKARIHCSWIERSKAKMERAWIKIMTQIHESKSSIQRHAKATTRNQIQFKHNDIWSLNPNINWNWKLLTRKRSTQVELRINKIINWKYMLQSKRKLVGAKKRIIAMLNHWTNI